MGIRLANSKKDLDRMTVGCLHLLREEILRSLMILGEQSVRRVRDRSGEDSWYDDTGNLRSSIGYGVYDHSNIIVTSAFEQVKQGSKGSAEGSRMINEIASEYRKVYALVVIAAMEYAELVEAKDNKDVLASTELWAKSKADEYVKKGIDRAMEKINQVIATI